MRRERNASKITLKGYDAIFGSKQEQVQEIPLEELHSFEHHPFKIVKDEEMDALVESIRQQGKILVPGLARKRAEGGYELISGHRRKEAGKLVGLSSMPVIVREVSKEEATIMMVDSNLQREHLLFSEKAFAYKMKFEVLKHSGRKLEKGTMEEIGEEANENSKKVQRYIRLTELIPELLTLVDEKKLGFISAVDISYLSKEEQKMLYDKIRQLCVIPNGVQATALKKYSLSGELNTGVVELLLTQETSKSKKVTLKSERIREYFSEEYTKEEIETVIYKLLDQWKQEGANKDGDHYKWK